MALPYSMNIRDIYEEIANISDQLFGSNNADRKKLVKRLLVLTYELDRRFNQ